MRSLALSLVGLLVARVAAAQPDPQPTPVPPADPPAPVPVTPVAPPPVAPAPTPAPAPPPPEPTYEERMALANYEPSSVRLGGFLQTQYRMRQDAGGAFDADDTNGFRIARIRLIGQGQTRAGNLELSAYVEGELQPDFVMLDAYATVNRPFKNGARVAIDGGQMRVPISRQNMLSDSRLAFVEKAQLATISPGRDLGMRVTIDAPRPEKERRRDIQLPQVRFIGGVFNGEGINQVENINERYLYTGRLEITALGQERQLAESMFGGRFVTIAGSIGHNGRSESSRLDTQTYVGFDIAGAYRGLSGSLEYLQVTHSQTVGGVDDPNTVDFKANGFTAQLNYLLPVKLPPLKQARFELGLRVEEIDRNDETPIVAPADPTQSVRATTAVASYYLRMHSLKAQLAFTHFKEVEFETVSGEDATFDNDQLLLQVTYRME